ncbi:MAG: hypothetical protein CVV05_11780 [Gammaproteobacteria bacterium HGW-Gammaproteobacteria-1]|jgi:hypothetical protein|nr:MAG: hypothetical protein CVV05_11780 [Gammaproteobacteria bacterium HGW-Gammaproteobacteria-1]
MERRLDAAPLRTAVTASLAAWLLLLAGSGTAWAGAREQARRMHDRLAGVPPTESVLADMEADIAANDARAAAYTAMENSAFYNVTLKNFVTPWTNEEQTMFAPLNDYSATVIGMVRDDIDFRLVLSGDILYIGSGAGVPAYSNSSNAHYETLQAQGADLKTVLVQTAQSTQTGLSLSATAGVLTTRASAKAFLMDGTNRAMLRFTMLNYLCRDLEQVMDITRAPHRIRQDVARSPGGDSRIYLNNCAGCHAGMDPLIQSFAYYGYAYDSATDPDGANGQLAYTPDVVQYKYLQNADNFKYGYVTPDDRWDNYWRQGSNAVLGWDGALPGGGYGAKSMGEELAHSDAFAQCQVQKVFKAVCLRAPGDSADRSQVATMVDAFRSSGHQLKRVFADAATYCMGD